jgi:hypothetical protein
MLIQIVLNHNNSNSNNKRIKKKILVASEPAVDNASVSGLGAYRHRSPIFASDWRTNVRL